MLVGLVSLFFEPLRNNVVFNFHQSVIIMPFWKCLLICLDRSILDYSEMIISDEGQNIKGIEKSCENEIEVWSIVSDGLDHITVKNKVISKTVSL